MLPVKQSINLYSGEFKPPEVPGSIKLLGQICGVIIGANLVCFFSLWSVQAIYQNSLTDQQEQQQQLNERLAELSAAMPKRNPDASLQQRLNREKEAIVKRRKVIEYLKNDDLNEGSSFVAPVGQLAKQKVDGIWLRQFRILNAGQDIELYGLAKKPHLVSKYLQQLSKHSAYQGRAFRQIEVHRSKQNSWNEFFLSTRKEQLDALAEDGL